MVLEKVAEENGLEVLAERYGSVRWEDAAKFLTQYAEDYQQWLVLTIGQRAAEHECDAYPEREKRIHQTLDNGGYLLYLTLKNNRADPENIAAYESFRQQAGAGIL